MPDDEDDDAVADVVREATCPTRITRLAWFSGGEGRVALGEPEQTAEEGPGEAAQQLRADGAKASFATSNEVLAKHTKTTHRRSEEESEEHPESVRGRRSRSLPCASDGRFDALPASSQLDSEEELKVGDRRGMDVWRVYVEEDSEVTGHYNL